MYISLKIRSRLNKKIKENSTKINKEIFPKDLKSS